MSRRAGRIRSSRGGTIRRDDPAERVIESCRERLDRGESVDFEAEIAAHPRLAARLRPAFALLARLDRTFPAPASTSLVGAALGPWRVTSRLGAGGMGEVFRCEDGRGATVAVKVVHAHLLGRPGFLDRFRREELLGRRIRHENVVATLDAADWAAAGAMRHCLVMEYVEGRTLRQLADELGRVPEELCRHVGLEIAKGLAAIHAAGVVHRDVKPENVIVTRENVVKVMDLGVARLVDESARLSQSAAFVGSFRYAAPEQFRRGGRDVDRRVDLFALGLVLYELATGAHPFSDDDLHVVIRRLLEEEPRRAAQLNPQLSPFLEEVVHRLLAKDPAARFASADEVALVLEGGEASAWWADRSRAIREATRRPLRRIRIPRETALHGRDAEMARLSALLAKAAAGDGQVVLVEGEAGIGKSRLVDEFVGAFAQAGGDVNFLFGSYPPGGAATASGAFSTAYREHLGDDEDAVRAALRQTPLLVPAFAALLSGDATPPGAEPLTKDSLQTVFVHATRSFAAERPTIVLIDDLHFAPEEGRALFASLALAVPGHRVLLVGCARPGLDQRWVGDIERLAHATRLVLPRLSPKDLVLMLRDSLRSEHLAEELAGRIAVKSDGNPFFVFEILRGLREGQFLTRRPDGTWATTRLIAEIDVPSSVVELVQARVSDLGADDRNVLEVAACVGFEFDPSLVGDVLRMERIPLLQRLGRIEKTQRLVRSAGRRFVFDHHQVMEVLYAGLSDPLREEYHAAIGTAIEARGGAAGREPRDVDGAVYVELAEHLLKGGQGVRALRYLDSALAHLERNHLNDAAVRLADRALAGPGLVPAATRFELLVRSARWVDKLGRRADQARRIGDAGEIARTTGDRAQRTRHLAEWGQYLCWVSRNEEALSALEEALALACAAGDEETQARASGAMGVALRSLGRHEESLRIQERHLAFRRAQGHAPGEADATTGLGSAFFALGRFDDAIREQRRAVEISRAVGARFSEAVATGNLGVALCATDRLDEASVLLERGLDLARQLGERRVEAHHTGSLACVRSSLGRLGEALALHERSLALHRELGNRNGEAHESSNLGALLFQLGRLDEAQSMLEEVLAASRAIADRDIEAAASIELAVVLDANDRRDEAIEHLERSVECCRRTGRREMELRATLEVGAMLAESGAAADAIRRLDGAVRMARELGSPGLSILSMAELARLPGGDPRAAEALLAAHASRLAVDQSLRARWALWRATAGRVHLAEATRLLDRLVAAAPEPFRATMIANVPLHRAVARAARDFNDRRDGRERDDESPAPVARP